MVLSGELILNNNTWPSKTFSPSVFYNFDCPGLPNLARMIEHCKADAEEDKSEKTQVPDVTSPMPSPIKPVRVSPQVSKTDASRRLIKIKHVLCRSSNVSSARSLSKLGGEKSTCRSGSGTDLSQEFSHSKKNDLNLAWMFANLRGWASKRDVFSNILCSSSVDIVGCTETHTTANKIDTPGFRYYSRNRSVQSNSKGGVAIGVRDKLAEHCIKVFEGKGSNECLMIKITCFKPEVVIGVYYGNQEGTTPAEVIRNNLQETLDELKRFRDLGYKTILGGDFNVHVGEYVVGNDSKISKGGQFLIDLCETYGFKIANNMLENPSHTHFDVSSKTSRVLDLVITDSVRSIEDIQVDTAKELTPYRITHEGNKIVRKYTDHLSIYGETSVRRVRTAKKKKIKVWSYKKPGAKDRFQHFTNEKADAAIKHIVEQPSCKQAVEEIYKLLERAKKESFELRTVTQRKMQKESDENLVTKRVKLLQGIADDMGGRKRLPQKVFSARKKIIGESEEMVEALDHYKTGKRLETREEVYESLMDYNSEVLTKNECASREDEEMMNEKRRIVDEFEKIETEESESDITWEEWKKVLEKVTTLNKTCYRDLVMAGHRWQAAMFMLFKRIYREEDIPSSFMNTKLKQLYKKKGDKAKLTSYRFIHLKDWAPKIMEKLAMQRCQSKLAAIMPEGQIGGMAKSSTLEHIYTILAIARMKMKEGSGLIVQFVDVMKCFDKQRLEDTLYAATTAGVSGKQIRVMRALHDNTVISLIGDPTEREETIKNSTGQGTNWAPLSCSLSMGQTIKKWDDMFAGNKVRVGRYEIDPLSFVDDTGRLAETAQQAREGGIALTNALNELGLKAHPDKSRMVIIGGKKYREKILKELEKDPVMIQDFELKTSDCETYLGVEISEKGVRDSVTKSIKKRIKAAVVKEIQISKILETDEMDRVGWIEAVKTLVNSIILSTITYAAPAFAFMTKSQVNEIELAFKEILFRQLRISRYSHYATVLLECNMIRVSDIINQYKISFVNELKYTKGAGICLKVLNEEQRLYPGTGLLDEVSNLCGLYGIDDVTLMDDVSKEEIKEKVWDKGRKDIWGDSVKNRRVPFNRYFFKTPKPYMTRSRYQSRLFFAFRIGELQFKDYRKGEFNKKFGNTECFMEGCNEPDRLDHVMRCEKYPSELRCELRNFNHDPNEQDEFIEYLTKLDKFRYDNFNLPVMYRPSLKKVLEREMKV